MKLTPEQIAEVAREHLSQVDALLVGTIALQHTQRWAAMVSAELGGKTVTGPELASSLLRVSKRLQAEHCAAN